MWHCSRDITVSQTVSLDCPDAQLCDDRLIQWPTVLHSLATGDGQVINCFLLTESKSKHLTLRSSICSKCKICTWCKIPHFDSLCSKKNIRSCLIRTLIRRQFAFLFTQFVSLISGRSFRQPFIPTATHLQTYERQYITVSVYRYETSVIFIRNTAGQDRSQ